MLSRWQSIAVFVSLWVLLAAFVPGHESWPGWLHVVAVVTIWTAAFFRAKDDGG